MGEDDDVSGDEDLAAALMSVAIKKHKAHSPAKHKVRGTLPYSKKSICQFIQSKGPVRHNPVKQSCMHPISHSSVLLPVMVPPPPHGAPQHTCPDPGFLFHVRVRAHPRRAVGMGVKRGQRPRV